MTKAREKLHNSYKYAKKLHPDFIEVFDDFCKQRGLNKTQELIKAMNYYIDLKLKVEKAEEKILKEEEKKLNELL